MNESRDTLEDRLQDYEARLGGLKSFVKELNDRAAEHGTAREHLEEDLFEAEHNVKHYEEGVAQLKAQIAKLGDVPNPGRRGTGGGGGGVGPALKSKKGIGIVMIGLGAAALAALGLKSRRGGKDDKK